MNKKSIEQMKESVKKRKPSFWIISCVVIVGVFFILMALPNVQPKMYEIERFTEAKETIYSPITIEDQKATESKKQQAMQAVEEQYTISENITEERMSYINEIFDAANKMNQDQKNQSIENEKGEPIKPLSDTEKLRNYLDLLSEEIVNNVNTKVLSTILNATEQNRNDAHEFLVEEVSGILQEGVKSSNLNQKRMEIERIVLYSDFTGEMQEALTSLGRFAIVENAFFDAEKTIEAQKEAANNVDPVIIRAGDVIVEEGEIITSEIYEDLALVGVLKSQGNYLPLFGLTLLTVILSAFIVLEWNRQGNWDKSKIFVIFIISIGMISILKAFSYFDSLEFPIYLAIPAAACSMIIKLLVTERFAIIMAAIYSIMGTVLLNMEMAGYLNVEAGIYLFFSQWAGIYFLKNVKDRMEIVRVGAAIFIVNVITIIMFMFISFEQLEFAATFIQFGLGLCSAFLSTVLTLGLMPFFEAGLNILSESKLLALSNPNHPLLRKILVETPGTYHHSVMVANLSEAACEAIGANGLLARVAAYYHDIGKSVNPQYFIENQMGKKNPHDLLKPEKSAEIIINHPYDGAYLLKKAKFPKEIIDIAEQHHGTTLLKYFYFKAKETNANVDEKVFRYPGPKPQTKEAAIVCICDSIEAAVRSMNHPTMDKIEETVRSIIQDKLNDGQFDECPLTLCDLNQIQKAVYELLKGIFHSRIEYPKETNGKATKEKI
jgi:cyclic-di-AMP phosphodiesterase PgpH